MFDGDLNFTTSNPLIIKGISEAPAISCEGRSSEKKSFIVESDYIKACKDGFGNKVGSETNKGSSMYPILEKYEVGSKEYEEMEYRIQCIQLEQQECIDSAKNGKAPQPLPSYWSDINCKELKYDIDEETGEILNTEEEIEWIEFNRKLVANKKPYYFIYIYEDLYKEYKNFIKELSTRARQSLGVSLQDIIRKDKKGQVLSEGEAKIMNCYREYCPVNNDYCIVNHISAIVEDRMEQLEKSAPSNLQSFDYKIYMNEDYKYYDKGTEVTKLKNLCKEYGTASADRIKWFGSIGTDGAFQENQDLDAWFNDSVMQTIPCKEELANTLIYLSYGKSVVSKFLAWTIAGDTILRNVINNTNGYISYPTRDEEGDIDFGGERFKMVDKYLGEEI